MIQKQAIHLNFSQGLDTKTDPNQVSFGRFLALENSIFQKGGLLQKRNGYQQLPNLAAQAQYVTTFRGDLTAIGTSLQAYSDGLDTWINRGAIQPISLSTQAVIRNNFNQTQVDYVVTPANIACVVYTEVNDGTTAYKFAVNDSITTQNYLVPTAISDASATYGTPRVFYLAPYFVIVYSSSVSTLKYLYINSTTFQVSSTAVISNVYAASTSVAFDGVVLNNALFLVWNGSGSTGIKAVYLTNTLIFSSVITIDAARQATHFSLCADSVNNVIWAHYYSSATSNGYVIALSTSLNVLPSFPVQTISGLPVVNLASTVIKRSNYGTVLFYEIAHNYTFVPIGTSITTPSNYIQYRDIDISGSISSISTVMRGVGLASKAFVYQSIPYVLSVYQTSNTSPLQNTYFLINLSGNVISKLAYQNARGYVTTALPQVNLSGSLVQIGYLYQNLIQGANKDTNVSGSIAPVYTQCGINAVAFNFTTNFQSVEIGNNLNIPGGFLFSYDGYISSEQNFFLYPDVVTLTAKTTSGGNMDHQLYYYVVCYEWTDNQGNLFQSAPSVPLKVDITSGGGGGTSTNTVTIAGPTLRQTYKTANPVKIVIYRWSVAQQVYYQVTSLTAPLVNNPTVDEWTYTDSASDASILGNRILYTTGGVVENIGPPSFSSVFLFDNRLWGISSEDPNLLWYSKQVIEATPVEMSDLFTVYIPPSLGAQGPSGNLLCGFPMDDKAVLFKKSSISYFNGTGPDNTGANSQYSPPILITSTLGCSNQNSIIFTPNGLMFQFSSQAGNQIWLLGRNLETTYIGAPVEALTLNANVLSAVNVPGTNQIRFTLDSGVTLMFDYFFMQWGTFTGIPALSSTLYNGLHTFINSLGNVFQETPGSYLDGSNPVLMSFTTSWISLAGIQGYQRAYFFYILAKYLSPHKLYCQLAYDYNPAIVQASLITPDNFVPTYGGPEATGVEATYGQDSPYGGAGNIENWRVFLARQRCSSFQITINEIYDPSLNVQAGAGFQMTGLNIVVGRKKDFSPISASRSVG